MINLNKQLTTEHCPCSIDYIAKWNLFVIGTYELSDHAKETINKRFGSIVLVQNNQLILEQKCSNGGVFDFRLLDSFEIASKIDLNKSSKEVSNDSKQSSKGKKESSKDEKESSKDEESTNSSKQFDQLSKKLSKGINEPLKGLSSQDSSSTSKAETRKVHRSFKVSKANSIKDRVKSDSIEDLFKNCSEDCSKDCLKSKLNHQPVQLYAAHSNGTLSVFEIVKLKDDFKIIETTSISTGYSMLTCLDLVKKEDCSKKAEVLVIVGDSCSTITIIKNQLILNRLRINQLDYPLWSIKILYLSSNQGTEQSSDEISSSQNDESSKEISSFKADQSSRAKYEENVLVFTGSDDCVLRCFALKNEFQDHQLLFKDDSFEGGVTSIELVSEQLDDVLNRKREDEMKDDARSDEKETSLQMKNNESKVESEANDESYRQTEDETKDAETRESNKNISNYRHKVLVGSYDEKVRIFTLDWAERENFRMKMMKVVPIEKAGIWKIKHHLRAGDDFCLITGMYSGFHLMKDGRLVYSFNDLPADEQCEESKVEKTKDENQLMQEIALNESEHLIYGCCFNSKLDQLLITSFYKKKVYCMKLEKEFLDQWIC